MRKTLYVFSRKNFHLSIFFYNRFIPHGLLLSAAVCAGESKASISYNIPGISQCLDFINLMTYDMHGSWSSHVGINAPLYAGPRDHSNGQVGLNVDACVRYWISAGAPREKLVFGIPTYGRSFTLQSPQNNLPGAISGGAGNRGKYTNEAGNLGYNEICEFKRSQLWTFVWEDNQKVPYAYCGHQWVGFDDVQSVRNKCKYVQNMNLGGAMVWSIDTDDFRNVSGDGRFALTKTIHECFQ